VPGCTTASVIAGEPTGPSVITRTITYTYDPLGRLTDADYSTGESFEYAYDAADNRAVFTSTTPLSGTLVTTYTFDAANRLTARSVSDGRSYTYDWSQRGQLLAETTQGVEVRTFTYDGAGRLVEATVFTLTTRFTYDGLGARTNVEVVGQGTTTVTLDYAAGNHILAETTPTGTVQYLYGRDCLGEFRDDEWLYYLNDGSDLVRQGADADGNVESTWLFDPDGTVLEGPEGPVSHLICGGVYDWSTGLIYKGGRYFDPSLGIWLALASLVVVQSWPGRKKRKGFPWHLAFVLFLVGVSGTLVGCQESICTEVPEGSEPFSPISKTAQTVEILNHSGPDVKATPLAGDSYSYDIQWKVNFEIEREPGTGNAGWVIQQIEYNIGGKDRNGQPIDDHDVYWEAWQVEADAVEPQIDPKHPEWDDNFFIVAGGSNGHKETRGIVKFYEYGGVPPGFVLAPEDHPSHGLYISYTPPSFWDYTGTCHAWKVEWTGLKEPGNKPCWSYSAVRGNLGKSDKWCGSW
jgi:YD repeat-containing protein